MKDYLIKHLQDNRGMLPDEAERAVETSWWLIEKALFHLKAVILHDLMEMGGPNWGEHLDKKKVDEYIRSIKI